MTISNEFINKLTQEGLKSKFPNPQIIAIRWLILIIAYFAVLISFSGFRPDILEKISQPLYLFEFGFMLSVGVLATYAASFLALPDGNQKSWIRFAPFIPLAFLIGILVEGIFSTNSISLSECMRSGHHECLIHLLLYSILPTMVMFYTIHKAAPIKCCWAGSMVGLSAASFGYIALRLVEKSDESAMLLVWHFLPVIAVVMIGMMVGKIYLSRIWK